MTNIKKRIYKSHTLFSQMYRFRGKIHHSGNFRYTVHQSKRPINHKLYQYMSVSIVNRSIKIDTCNDMRILVYPCYVHY